MIELVPQVSTRDPTGILEVGSIMTVAMGEDRRVEGKKILYEETQRNLQLEDQMGGWKLLP